MDTKYVPSQLVIRRDLSQEISEKMDKISGNPDSYSSRQKQVRDNLNGLGDVHSFWIENPELRRALFRSDANSEEHALKIAKKGIRRVNDAWYYLLDIGRGHDFIDLLNPEIVKGVNGIVNGTRAKDGEYRKIDPNRGTGEVTLNFKNYTVPSPTKVPDLVYESIGNTVEKYSADPLEASIGLHLSLALSQPFPEGNKRTARLLQDRLLFDAGMPPAMISAGEGKFYFHLLEKVAPAWKDKDLQGQEVFYNYIASKVNNGLDLILEDLLVSERYGSAE